MEATPQRPWILRQRWHRLLFAHWPCDPVAVARLLPAGLILDTYDDAAWIGVIPFLITGLRARWLPPVPFGHRFLELNVRTYVRRDDRPGVWFFSLDAASWPAVIGARVAYHLPYHRATMRERVTEGVVSYSSMRRGGAALFAGTYAPEGLAGESPAGSLAEWLTERYCLYAADSRGWLFRTDIAHQRWALQPARATIAVNTMGAANSLALAGEPLLHFARHMDVRTWAPVRVTRH